jgi:hypothetical protein
VPRGARAALAVLMLAGASSAPKAAARPDAAAPPATLVERHDGVEIDWSAGTVTATAGSAADLHMPGADVARAGALRRAEAEARARLARALAELPAGAGRKLDGASRARALGRAQVTGTDPQSNGGAFVHVTARFADWLDARDAAPVVVLAMPAMHLAAAPLAKLDGEAHDVALGAAVYRLGSPPAAANAVRAKVDHAGRLVFSNGHDLTLGDRLAKGTTLIYVGKVLR